MNPQFRYPDFPPVHKQIDCKHGKAELKKRKAGP
jgi:hypothetical protein